MKYSILYSGDYNFQILRILKNISMDDAWDLANKLFADNEEIEHYDLMFFDSLEDLNSWLFHAIKNERNQQNK